MYIKMKISKKADKTSKVINLICLELIEVDGLEGLGVFNLILLYFGFNI